MHISTLRSYQALRAFALLATVGLALCTTAWSGEVVYSVGGLDPASQNITDATGTLNQAVTAINNAARDYSNAPGDARVSIDVTASQTSTVPAANDAAWFLHGGGTPATNSDPNGFESVAIDGALAGGGRATLSTTVDQSVLKIVNVDDAITVENLVVTGGTLRPANDVSGGGGGMRLGTLLNQATPDDTIATDTITLNNVVVEGNTVHVNTTAGGTNGRNAFGGGVYALGSSYNAASAVDSIVSDVTFTGVNLRDNHISLTAATADNSSTMGGGARIAYSNSFAFDGGSVDSNTNTLTRGSHAHGGGISYDGSHVDVNAGGATLKGVSFTNNMVKAIGKGDASVLESFARGGGFFGFSLAGGGASSYAFQDGTSFTGNAAVASGTGVVASGGAVHLRESVNATFTGTVFRGNSATADNGGRAVGGAVATDSVDGANNRSLTFVNATFDSNTASGVTAYGGAVYMGSGGDVTVTSEANASSLFAGNRANGLASGIHFDNNGATTNDGSLTINGQGRTYLLDPVTANMGADEFVFAKNGDGTLIWGGRNVLSSTAVQGSQVNLNAGTTILAKDFTLGVRNIGDVLKVDLDAASTMQFTADRLNPGQAYFDFKHADASSSLVVDSGARLTYDSGRTFRDVRGDFVLIKDEDGVLADKDTIAANLDANRGDYISGVRASGDAIIATVTGNPLHDTLMASGANSRAAQNALEQYVNVKNANGTYYFNDDQFDFIKNNLNRATPEIALARASAAIHSATSLAETAVEYGLRRFYRDGSSIASVSSESGLARLNGGPGPRFWLGYQADFNNVDSSHGYNGYKLKQHGVVAGFNYDINQCSSVGIYAGYSHGKTKSRNISGEVDTNSLHLGLIGRFAPVAALPQFSLLADLGYVYGHNDSWRRLESTALIPGHRLDAEFNQHLYTAALAAEYEFRYLNFSLTPSLGVRWVHLRQRSFNEGDNLLGMRANSFSGDSLATTLGVEAGYDFRCGPAVITPIVGLGWRQEWADRSFATTARYNIPGAIGTKVNSGPTDRGTAEIKAAIRTGVDIGNGRRLGLNLAYNLSLSGNTDNHSFYAGAELSF